MKEIIDKGIVWIEKLLKMEEKYGFFRFLRVILLLLLTSIVLLTITNPRYIFNNIERIRIEQHDESVIRRIQADADIRIILNRMLHTLNADRSWLIELHNGSKNLSSGLPFLYGDMRIEEVADGISNVDEEYADFQLSKLPLITQILNDGFYYGKIDSIKYIDERMYFKFKSNNVNEIAILALYSGEKPLGMIGASFCGGKEMGENTWKVIRKYGIQVASLLSN